MNKNIDMKDGKYGVEKLKQACLEIVDLAIEITVIAPNGVNLMEWIGLGDNALSIGRLIIEADQIKKELLDLNFSEKEAINKYVFEHLPKKKRKKIEVSEYIVGDIIQQSIDILLSISLLTKSIKSLLTK